MANPRVTIQLDRFRTTKQQKLLKLLNDKGVREEVNERIKDSINEFVPMKSGALRKSARVTANTISWGTGLKYARYQYFGEVYGPNYPIMRQGTIVGWYSRRGMKKYPTGRELGVPGFWKGWRFGYTTPGTHHHWDEYYKYLPKMRTNLEITRLLKRECKNRGLRV